MASGMRYSPKWTQKPTMNEAADGKNLLIECRLTSDSEPQIAWLVNDAQVQDGGRYKLVFKKESGNAYYASLNVSDTQKKSNTTKYEVKTRNDAGESSATVNSFLG
ncbi:twitchin-like [Paramacrobiotus metropolitanus]|uniref:twitchin-like n=1 Tax=Paramacrobiotus metropolitanus TaxID=2943436 RepID=UPI002445F43D|nr:twitchin-like [Paramacrobiotus metropolitanus]